MKCGGLSESDLESITEILSREDVPFSVGKDEEIVEFNENSIKRNLRHYSPPNLSLHILAITIEDEHFDRISPSGKSQLLDLGITDEVPSMEDFALTPAETIHSTLSKHPNRMVATNLKHQLLLALIIAAAFLFLKLLT